MMESFMEQQTDSTTTQTQSDQNTQVIEVDNNNRRIHDDDTKNILSKMNLATRSTVWELEPVEIAYLYSIIRLKVNGKKVMTKKEIHRAMLREMCKRRRRK